MVIGPILLGLLSFTPFDLLKCTLIEFLCIKKPLHRCQTEGIQYRDLLHMRWRSEDTEERLHQVLLYTEVAAFPVAE